MRTIVIGDLHGMYDETLELMDKCDVNNDDRLIFTGDLVDRGPDSAKCVNLAMAWTDITGQPSCIMGNHEAKHLKYWAVQESGQDIGSIPPTHVETRSQMTTAYYDFLRSLPYMIRLPEYNAAIVHAGVFPGRSLADQTKGHMVHIQMINPERDEQSKWPSKCKPGDGYRFWSTLWDGFERIIFGHTVLSKPLITDRVAGIDGGACFGGQLHALILPDWEIVSVQSKRNFGRATVDGAADRAKMYHLEGDVYTYS